jgi:predicted CopG family antitoxin
MTVPTQYKRMQITVSMPIEIYKKIQDYKKEIYNYTDYVTDYISDNKTMNIILEQFFAKKGDENARKSKKND